MPTTDALIGHGLVFEFADPATPTTFTYVAEIFDVTPPSAEVDQIDVTHMASPNKVREYIDGLIEPGVCSFSLNYVPGSATDVALRAARGAGRKICRITHKTGVSVTFDAQLQTYTPAIPTGEQMTAEVSWKVSGDPVQSAVAAPRNVVAPSLSGTEEVGQILTCDPGVWAGATSITFQWQNDAGTGTWANISGATSKSYVLQSTDEGDDVRCTVTGTNDSFSTSVNTTETGAIAAAS